MEILLNWLWQGTALAVVVALGLRACRTMNAATRERIWWMALAAVAVMPLAHLWPSAAARAGAAVAHAQPAAVVALHMDPDSWLLPIAAVWVVWAGVSIVRLGAALVHLRRAKALAVPLPPDRESRLRTWMAVRARGRRTRLVVSARVHRAAVLGLGRPVIALAPEALAQLTDAELDQVVIHEYAHVQRRDDLAIVVQRLISTVAGLHPAIAWLDRALTIEREVACDDWVVAHTGASRQYAASLVRLAVPAAAARWTIAPGAVRSAPQLRTRVVRLLDGRRNTSLERSTSAVGLVLTLIAGLIVAGVATPLIQVRDARAQAGPAAAPVSVAAGGPEHATTLIDRAAPQVASAQPVIARGVPRRASGADVRAAVAVPPPLGDVIDVAAPGVARGTAGSASGDPQGGEASQVRDLLPATHVPVTAAAGRDEVAAAPRQESPWAATARAGLAVGNGSREAALRTARFATRLSKSVAARFEPTRR